MMILIRAVSERASERVSPEDELLMGRLWKWLKGRDGEN